MRVDPAAIAALASALLAAAACAGDQRLPDVRTAPRTGEDASSAPAPPEAAQPGPATRPLVEIRGNLVFNQHVYRALLDLPEGAHADAATASLVEARLRSFLFRAGYLLASVSARVVDGQLVVDLDEGQLDKVVILGAGGWDAVRFHLDFDLPFDVYNRPLIDERLTSLCLQYGLLRCTATLFDVDPQPESRLGQQAIKGLEKLTGVGAFVPKELGRGARARALQVRLEQAPQHSGFWPAIDVSGPDGVLVGASGYLGDLPLQGGSTEVKLRAGAAVRPHLDASGSSVVLTRALAEARIRLPTVIGGQLRPAIGVLTDVTSRQRGDLGIDSVTQARLEAALVADFTSSGHALEAGAGLGVRRNLIFGLRTVPPVDTVVAATPSNLFFPFVLAFLNVDFSRDQMRWDRHHRLGVVARARSFSTGASPGASGFGELAVDGSYQRYVGLGWHELWVRTHVTFHAGDVLYTDEESLSGELRGGLGEIFLRKAGSVLTELRYSLVRDLLKVSVFDSLALFGRVLDRTNVDERVRGAAAVGFGVHGLVLTVLTVDFFASLAWTTDGSFGPAISLEVHEAFH